MSKADVSFMVPLFDLALQLADDESEEPTLGLGLIAPDSALAKDDAELEGYWITVLVNNAIGAALDHVITFREILRAPGARVTNNAPWTLVRGMLEPAALALWLLTGKGRQGRQERALCTWHHDFRERGKWGRPAPGTKQAGPDRRRTSHANAGHRWSARYRPTTLDPVPLQQGGRRRG